MSRSTSSSSSSGPTLLEIGRITRPHGLRGEVSVELVTDRVERLDPGAELMVGDTTLTVSASRPHQDRWLVFFEGVTTREGADALRGAVLRADELDEPDVLWVHQLIGSEVATPDGVRHGQVVAVEANPASDLLVLESGALIPVRFVVELVDGLVTVEVPAGLLDEDGD